MSNRRAIDYINNQRQEERDRRERESREEERQARDQAAQDAKDAQDEEDSYYYGLKDSGDSSSSSTPIDRVGVFIPVVDMMELHCNLVVKIITVLSFLFALVGVALNFDIFNGYFPDHRLLIPVVFPLIIGVASFLLYWALIVTLNLLGMFLSFIYFVRMPIIALSIAVAVYVAYPYILPA